MQEKTEEKARRGSPNTASFLVVASFVNHETFYLISSGKTTHAQALAKGANVPNDITIPNICI